MTVSETFRIFFKNSKYYFKMFDEIGFEKFNVVFKLKIRNKLSTWKAKSLSFAGRITLLKVVLQSIPIYLISCAWVPRSVLVKLEKSFRFLMWCHDGARKGVHEVA